MPKILLTGILLAGFVAGSLAMAAEADEFTAAARSAVAALGSELKAALGGAIKEGGPVHAIKVCNMHAPEIAARVSAQTGLTVGRTALRVRNPANAPTDWQREVLQSFEQRLRRGEAPATIEWQTTVTTPAGVEHRYMKPIMTGALCLTCHGATLAPEVAAAIRERYPQDQATGFGVGDLRGAFVVTARGD
ncbi:MAG: DUF3365 domain-containing protein [Candidatus Dadabacteria bacterium]|nr:MAG: DUF3365 domain-containing protein [Candidatus Dadabacteria bacterium]